MLIFSQSTHHYKHSLRILGTLCITKLPAESACLALQSLHAAAGAEVCCLPSRPVKSMSSLFRLQHTTLAFPPEAWPSFRISTVFQPEHAPPIGESVSSATYTVSESTLKRPEYGLLTNSGEQPVASRADAAAKVIVFLIPLSFAGLRSPRR